MRIVYISYLHPAIAPGGAQQVAYELYRASVKAGHDAYMIAALEADHERAYGKPGAPIVPMAGSEREFFYFPQCYDFLHLSVSDWRSIEFLRKLLEKLRPDVVHIHHYHRVGVETIRAARLAAPEALICLTFHEMMAICMADGQMVKKSSRELCTAATPIDCHACFPSLRPEFVELRAERLKAMFSDCNLFVFPSEFLADRYVDWGLPAERCVVIPNGQDDLSTPELREKHSRDLNRFGFFGQFIDNKGIDVILSALLTLSRERRLPACGIVFEINGGNRHYASPPYLEKVKGLVEEIKALKDPLIQIVDRGAYTRQQLASRMESVDWVIAPSTWWEVFGLVVSEAWMFRRPVIASAIAGLDERITEGLNGLKFTVRDPRALADVIAHAANNTQLWETLRAGIVPNWSNEDMLDAHLAVWKDTTPETTAITSYAAG